MLSSGCSDQWISQKVLRFGCSVFLRNLKRGSVVLRWCSDGAEHEKTLWLWLVLIPIFSSFLGLKLVEFDLRSTKGGVFFFCQWTMRSEAILICLSRIENPIPCQLWVGLGGFSWNRYYLHKTPWIIKPVWIFVTELPFQKKLDFSPSKCVRFISSLTS